MGKPQIPLRQVLSGRGNRLTTACLLITSVIAACSQTTPTPELDHCQALSAPANVVFNHQPNWQQSEDLPRYCQVRGTIAGRIQFELRLAEQWNGRFMMAGCGGFCGAVVPDKTGYSNSINHALKRGYAAITHDGGHQAPSWDTSWAWNDPEALEIWGHKSLPMVTEAGVAMATAFYGKAPAYRYFSGCSNGGRQGLIAAQRYPDLFDGVAAGGSIFEVSGIAGLWGNWMVAESNQPQQIPQAKMALLHREVVRQCDGGDGLVDGLISDPRRCNFDFSALQCSAEDGPDCFTAHQLGVLQKLYGGVQTRNGATIYPGMEFGGEYFADLWLFGPPGQPGWGVKSSIGYRDLLTHSLFAKSYPMAVDTDTMLRLNEASSVPQVIDANNPDLSGLAAADTKLLIYHGWADPLIIPGPMVDYYQQADAIATASGRHLQDHARLFMLPGWGHCWERPSQGYDQFDPLQELERWVEQGKAPDAITAAKLDANGNKIGERPICAWPSVASYRGNGAVEDAGSFSCQ